MDAFILTGAFCILNRNPRYLTELAARGTAILVITGATWRDLALSCAADPDHPASTIADFAFVDGDPNSETAFTAGALAAVQRWSTRYTIVGVQPAGETLVDASGLIADALGLPGPGPRAARACRSKALQRLYLPECSPPSIVVPAGERDSFDHGVVGFPAVVKPTGRHSSSGVVAVADEAELRARLAGYPEHETLVVEDLVAGQEFSVESLMQHEKVLFSSVTGKRTTGLDSRVFVELAHSVPNAGDEHVDGLLLDANQRMLERLAFGNGVVHSEWRLDSGGRPVLMEVAARTPGGGLTTLYELATGAPLEPEILRIALGEPAAYPAPRRYARQVYLEPDPGVLDDVTVDWPGVHPQWVGPADVWPDIRAGAADDPPALRAVLVLRERGTRLGPLRSGDDRAVTFFVDAASPGELDRLEASARAAVRVHTTRQPLR